MEGASVPPEYFWKAIITTDPSTGAENAISLIIHNETGLGGLDDYIVSIADLEELIGASNVGITAWSTVKNMLPNSTWALPSNCDLS